MGMRNYISRKFSDEFKDAGSGANFENNWSRLEIKRMLDNSSWSFSENLASVYLTGKRLFWIRGQDGDYWLGP